MEITNRTILSVADLNAEVNQLLTQGFPLLWVEGEISNLVRPASGHLYFTLKDNKSQIRSAMFRNRNMKLSIQPKNGMKVLVRGRVGLYEPRGDYQLIAEHMEDAGVGLLQKQFEALKQKLSSAGLFDQDHKKELPEYPKRIAVITSPTGAAIRDILHILERRSPHTPVLIYPVSVQGNMAKTEIETSIRQVNVDKKCDVIILARGGGSIEDLWSFNEENVANAIYHSKIPIICGVGHEIDFTIADFVADVRAPTPSAAAELVTPDASQLVTYVMQTQLWLEQNIKQDIKQKQQKLDWLMTRLHIQKPSHNIEQQSQRLDELETRLHQYFSHYLDNHKTKLNTFYSRLLSNSPKKLIDQRKLALHHQTTGLLQAINVTINHHQSAFKLQMATLDASSPLRTLDRGYAIIKDNKSKTIISTVNTLKPEQSINITFKDGDATAIIKKINAVTAKGLSNDIKNP